MSFGFLGIQFGFGLQLANMSAIYEVLGATPDRLPLLWLAAPLSGLIIQPLIGNASDRTWGKLGRTAAVLSGRGDVELADAGVDAEFVNVVDGCGRALDS